MKGNKKGLSDVVTSVLLILLVLASVVILWQFLRPAIEKGGKSITTVCMSLELQPISCKIVAGEPTKADVTYKWVSGDVNLTGVKLILQGLSGNSKVIEGDVLNRLETKTKEGVDFGETPANFNVAGVALSEAGVPTPCPEYKDAVVCS